jgi:outer membrane protein OmpA-like peptidoglycan-associated protein
MNRLPRRSLGEGGSSWGHDLSFSGLSRQGLFLYQFRNLKHFTFNQYIQNILRLETGMHSAALWKADVDAESRYLVTGSNDKTVRVWDLSSYKLVRTLRPPIGQGVEGRIRAVAISPDGETIACGGITGKSWEDSYCVYLFNRRSGELIRRLKGLPGSIHHLVYSKDGRFLAVGFYKGLRVYRTPAYTIVGQDHDYGLSCRSVDFSTKERLATASYDGYIRLYKVSDKGIVRIAKQKAPSGSQLFSLKFSADGRKLAVGYFKDKNSPPTIDALVFPKTEQKAKTRTINETQTTKSRGIKIVTEKNGAIVGETIYLSEKRTEPGVNLKIKFDFDSYTIRSESFALMDELGNALTDEKLMSKDIIIKGHTDSIGTETYNLKLSLKRALAVKMYLTENFPIPTSRLKVAGYGESLPLISNSNEADRQINRRVEIVAE